METMKNHDYPDYADDPVKQEADKLLSSGEAETEEEALTIAEYMDCIMTDEEAELVEKRRD